MIFEYTSGFFVYECYLYVIEFDWNKMNKQFDLLPFLSLNILSKYASIMSVNYNLITDEHYFTNCTQISKIQYRVSK